MNEKERESELVTFFPVAFYNFYLWVKCGFDLNKFCIDFITKMFTVIGKAETFCRKMSEESDNFMTII